MWRLGLRLAVRGGREALVRLMVTALAITIGTTLLLGALAAFHGYKVASYKPCLSCVTKATQDSSEATLWLYRKDVYKNQTIERVDLAALGSYALKIPGVSSMPKAGEYYASPALAKLLSSVPQDELGNRFPGRQIGTIGSEALSGPDALVIIIGRTTTDLSPLSSVTHVQSVGTAQAIPTSTGLSAAFLQFVLGISAVGLLFPMLVLVGSATRLSAARREERYAAFRLVGATPRQINTIASMDATLGAVIGVIIGTGILLALRPTLGNLAYTGHRFFAADVTPTMFGYIGVLLGVPIAAIVASLLSLRRVRISPLGVSRKATGNAPRTWEVLPLLAGAGLFIGAALLISRDEPNTLVVIPGLVLIMVGIIIGGPWLTLRVTRLVAKAANGPSILLATRRLADNPKAAFRSVSGLVLAIFVGSVIAGIVPIVIKADYSTTSNELTNVLPVGLFGPQNPGLASREGQQLIHQLQSYSGVKVFPIYLQPVALPSAPPEGPEGPPVPPPAGLKPPIVMSCATLKELRVLGECASGVQTVKLTDPDKLITNHTTSLIATTASQSVSGDITGWQLRSMLVKVTDPDSLEKVRTLLAQRVVLSQSYNDVLLTYGEFQENARSANKNLQALVSAGIVLTLIIAGCSLAVAVGGSLVERKRPFMLLRLSGAPLTSLYKVVIWESIIPLVSVVAVAAASGFGISALAIARLAPKGTNIPLPGLAYSTTLAAGLVICMLVVLVTLPLLGRLTKPDNARFE